MKKLVWLLFVVAAMFCSCEKEEDSESNGFSSKGIEIYGKVDFNPCDYMSQFTVFLADSVSGTNYKVGAFLYQSSNVYLDFRLDEAFNHLKGTSRYLVFIVDYEYEGCFYTATILKSFYFSDELFLGEIGFADYYWFSSPALKVVNITTGDKAF